MSELTLTVLGQLVASGKSDAAIGREYGITEYSIRAMRVRHGIPTRGELRKTYLATLSPNFLVSYPPTPEELRWWLTRDFRDREIAERYGVRTESVTSLRKRYMLTGTGTDSNTPPNHRSRAKPKHKTDLPDWVSFEDIEPEKVKDEVRLVEYRRTAASKFVPRNYAARNDPAFRRLVIA